MMSHPPFPPRDFNTVTHDDRLRRREVDDAIYKNLCLDGLSKFVSTMTLLHPNWATENPSLRLKVEEQLCSVAFSSSAPLPISAVAQDMGYELQHDQLIKVGATVARLYREKHRIEPPKKASMHGDERRVNAYSEADRDLIVSALNQFFGT